MPKHAMPTIRTEAELDGWSATVENRLDVLRAAIKGGISTDAARPAAARISKESAVNLARVFLAVKTRDKEQLEELGVKAGTIEGAEKAVLGTPLTGDTATGSYLVPTQYLAEVIALAEAQSDLMPRVRRVEMTARQLKVPTKSTGVSFTRVTSETAALTEVNPTFGEETLTAYTYALWLGVSEEAVEDSLANLGQYLAAQIAEAYTASFETEFLNTNDGTITGLLHDSGVNTVTMGAGKVAFADLDSDDLLDLIKALTTKAKRRGAVYILHPTTLDVVAGKKDANGNPIFKQLREGAPATIHGYPYITSDQMPDSSDSAVSTPFIAFGNPGLLTFGDRKGLEIRYYDGTAYGVQYAEVFWRARYRGAYNIPIPGAFAVLKTAAS